MCVFVCVSFHSFVVKCVWVWTAAEWIRRRASDQPKPSTEMGFRCAVSRLLLFLVSLASRSTELTVPVCIRLSRLGQQVLGRAGVAGVRLLGRSRPAGRRLAAGRSFQLAARRQTGRRPERRPDAGRRRPAPLESLVAAPAGTRHLRSPRGHYRAEPVGH